MSTTEKETDFFVVGGTLSPDARCYVKRPADEQLFNLTLVGEFCYVLTARQMGKSSLMIRTADRLKNEKINVAIIDLTAIGSEGESVDKWLRSLLTKLKEGLKLTVDLETWWHKHISLSTMHRFTKFLRDVVLTEIKGKTVIFIDEIDITLNLDFSDDFFAAIRSIFNARTEDPAYKRLTFVLLGAAIPSDLIKKPTLTPFNIGHEIDLHDLNRRDAQKLEQGLTQVDPGREDIILDRIFYWTNGHPYLTQKLCKEVIAEAEDGHWDEKRIDRLVDQVFLSKGARGEENLQFVNDRVSSCPQILRLLAIYDQVYRGKVVREDRQSISQTQLKRFGLVQVEDDKLKIRNEIYRKVFNRKWIKEYRPVNWRRRTMIVVIVALILISILGIYIWQIPQPAEVIAHNNLNTLAEMFNQNENNRARNLFDSLSLDEKISIFTYATPDLQPQVRAVVKGTYTDLENIEDDNRLLEAMQSALRQFEGEGGELKNEIMHWLTGRAAANQNNYLEAVLAYEEAINLNDKNPATHFELAGILTTLGNYEEALKEFEIVLNLSESWQNRVEQVSRGNEQIYEILEVNREAYPALTELLLAPFFNVYTDANASDNTFIPSGFMGDTGDVTINEVWNENPYSGNTVIKVIYDARGQGPYQCGSGVTPAPACKWAGVYWLEPADNFGEICDVGYDLTGFKKITFWARSDELVVVKFLVGGVGWGRPESPPCPDSLQNPRNSGWVTLGPEWTQIKIDLEGADLSYVIGGFGWVTNWPNNEITQDNPKTLVFYLDQIRFER